MKTRILSLPALALLLGTLFPFFACHISTVDQDGNVFSFPSLADSLAGADHATLLLKDTSGEVVDTLFHGPVTANTEFRKLEASGYKGGLIIISIEGSRSGTVIYQEERRYDGVQVTRGPIIRPDSDSLVLVQSVAVRPPSMNLYVNGESRTLTASISPSTLSGRFLWRSSDPSIAAVDAEGTVKPGSAGIAYVSVLALADSTKRDSALITVKQDMPRLMVGRDTLIAAGRTISYSLEVTQEYGNVVLCKWDLDGDGTYEDSSTSLPKDISQAYPAAREYQVRFHVRDTEGNDTTVIRKVTAVAGPVILFHSPENGAHVNQSPISVTWSVDGVRQAASEPLVEGSNTISRSATDAAGNTYSATLTLHLDTQPPVVRISAPVEGQLTRSPSISVSWTVDAVAQVTRNVEPLEGKQGKIAIIREFLDAAGNRGADTISIFRDTLAPGTVSFVSPTSPAVVNMAHPQAVQWAWTRTGEAADSFLVSLNGAAEVKQAGTSYVLAGPGNQSYTLQVREVDAAGNISAPASHAVLVDKLAPPAPTVSGTTPTGSPTWTWTAGSGSDGARVFRYRLASATAYSAEGPETSHSPSGLASGTHTLFVQERDAAGNWSTEGSFSIAVDRDGPKVSVTGPSEFGRVVANTNPTLSGLVDDAHKIRRVEYRINSGDYVTAALVGGNWSFAATYPSGTNTVWVRGEDEFGNRDSVQTRIYKYPHVVFVRKGATGSGKSWEDAIGELHQVLDSNKIFDAGTEIWVSKGKYKAKSTQDHLIILSSNIKVIGGFFTDRASTDLNQRDLTEGATILAGRMRIGENDDWAPYVNAVTLDGFTIKGDLNESATIKAWKNTDQISFRNIKAMGIRDEEIILSLGSGHVSLENCEFTDNYTYQDFLIEIEGTGTMLNCRMVNNGSTGGPSPLIFRIQLDVQGGYYSGNYEDGYPRTYFQFFLGADYQILTIDNAQIQGGIAGIKRNPPGVGTLNYGSGNITLPGP